MDLKLALEAISIKEKNKYNGSVNNSSTSKSNNSNAGILWNILEWFGLKSYINYKNTNIKMKYNEVYCTGQLS